MAPASLDDESNNSTISLLGSFPADACQVGNITGSPLRSPV